MNWQTIADGRSYVCSLHIESAASIYSGGMDDLVRLTLGGLLDDPHLAATHTRMFFVRYVDDAPHLRLRLITPKLDLCGRAERRLQLLLPALQQPALQYRYVPYEPEWDRYGGREALDVAHSIFCASSRAAVRLVSDGKRPDPAQRQGRALYAMLLTLHCLFRDREVASRVAQRHADGYRALLRSACTDAEAIESDDLQRRIVSAWSSLDRNEIPAELRGYHRSLMHARRCLQGLADSRRIYSGAHVFGDYTSAMTWIGPSYMHMMNNRLGITIPQEARWARVIASALRGA